MRRGRRTLRNVTIKGIDKFIVGAIHESPAKYSGSVADDSIHCRGDLWSPVRFAEYLRATAGRPYKKELDKSKFVEIKSVGAIGIYTEKRKDSGCCPFHMDIQKKIDKFKPT